MNLLVAARWSLLRAAPPPGRPALLLEGSWPQPDRSPLHDALDDAIDDRFAWIDGEAVELASALEGSSAAYLNALALRYHMVKLLRPVAYFTELRPLAPGARVELLAAPGDEDYAELLAEICRAAGAELVVRRVDGSATPAPAFPPNPRWRRWAGRLGSRLAPRDRNVRSDRIHAVANTGKRRPCRGRPDESGHYEHLPHSPSDPRPRVVLCGNPRLLGPVCAELRRCGCRVWWLFDRFALKPWLRWRPAGVGQLVCDSSLGELSRLRVEVPERIECRGINLAGPVRRWLSARAETHGPRQTRLVERIDAHFRRLKPDAVVLDEDATPLARAAVAAARRYGAVSLVVQHGLPCCRFGFAPLAADRFLAWDRASAERLIAWGVGEDRIAAAEREDSSASTGTTAFQGRRGAGRSTALEGRRRAGRSTALEGRRRAGRSTALEGRRTKSGELRSGFRVLLFCTTPPRDRRPDAVAMNLNRRTYAGMLRAAFSAVAALGDAELIVKPHPRAPDDPMVREIRKEFARLRVKIVGRARLAAWLRRVGCVLSCFSTAGVEAAAAGLPVIQLAPPGAVDVPRAERFGMLGTATTEAELLRLLDEVLRGTREPACGPNPQVFAGPNGSAARIAEEVVSAITLVPTQSVGTSQYSSTPSLQHSATPTLQHSLTPPPP